MTGQTAAENYQAHLDAVSRAFFAGDLDRTGCHIALPCSLHTRDRLQRIGHLEEFPIMLCEQDDGLRRLGVTDDHRICVKAEFTGPTGQHIRGRYRTALLRGGSCQMRNSDLTIVGPQRMESLRHSMADSEKGER